MPAAITLRPLTPADQPLLVKHLNDARVTQYLSDRIPSPYKAQDAQWWVNIGSKEVGMVKAIEVNGEFCGVIGAYFDQGNSSNDAELGYWLGQSYWNQGIATDAVMQFCQLLFSRTNITRLFNPVTAVNTGSIRVMQKAGFKLQKTLAKSALHNGKTYDEHLYCLERKR